MRRRRPPAPSVSLTAEPVLRAGAETTIGIEADAGPVRVSLRLLGWDMRRAAKWPLAELGAGSHRVRIPAGLAPGCARMTEYAIVAELGRTVTATRVGLIGDQVWWPDGPRAHGDITLSDEAVEVGGVVRGETAGPGELGAELHTLVGTAAPRFLAVATVPGGPFAVTLPHDVAPTLCDGEELAIAWTVRAGEAWHRFAVTDPQGRAAERRPALLTFLARLARDPFLAG